VQTLAHGFQEHGFLAGVARPYLLDLTERYGWPVSLLTPVGHAMVLRDSTHQVSALTYHHYYPGHAFPMLDSASGLAYLAHLTDERRADMLSALKLLPRRDNIHKIGLFETTDFAADIRRAGVATASYNQFTRNPGKTSSIAAPVMGADGVAGAITVAFFSVAMKMGVAVDRLAGPLGEAAVAIGEALSSRPHANAFNPQAGKREVDHVAG
jgi:IclR family mhp operon transcriptional activator